MEFLGDSFLKIATTRHIYEENPDAGAGGLTRIRGALIRNSNLLKLAELKCSNGSEIKLPSLMNIKLNIDTVVGSFYSYSYAKTSEKEVYSSDEAEQPS